MPSTLIRLTKADVTARDAVPNVRFVPFKKTDADQQLVWGEIYSPLALPDTQGDFMSAESIRQMMFDFMHKSDMYALDTGHSRQKNGSCIVEMFQARPGDPDFIVGSWVAGVHVSDTAWPLVKSGEINGFSVDGSAMATDTTVMVDLPDVLHGETDAVNGESHLFYVELDSDGALLGGETSPGRDGHVHKIVRGVCTEDAGGHSHRFSYVEGVLAVGGHN